MHFLKPHYETVGPFGLPMKDAQARAIDANHMMQSRPSDQEL